MQTNEIMNMPATTNRNQLMLMLIGIAAMTSETQSLIGASLYFSIGNQTRITSKPDSARPRRNIDQSPISRPKNRPAVVSRANMSLSHFLSKETCPLFEARYRTLGIGFVFV